MPDIFDTLAGKDNSLTNSPGGGDVFDKLAQGGSSSRITGRKPDIFDKLWASSSPVQNLNPTEGPKQDSLFGPILRSLNPINWPHMVLDTPRALFDAPATIEEGVTGKRRLFPKVENIGPIVGNFFEDNPPSGFTKDQWRALPQSEKDKYPYAKDESQSGAIVPGLGFVQYGGKGGMVPNPIPGLNLQPPQPLGPGMSKVMDVVQSIGEPVGAAISDVSRLENLPLALGMSEGVVGDLAANVIRKVLAAAMIGELPQQVEKRAQVEGANLGHDTLNAAIRTVMGSGVDTALPVLVGMHSPEAPKFFQPGVDIQEIVKQGDPGFPFIMKDAPRRVFNMPDKEGEKTFTMPVIGQKPQVGPGIVTREMLQQSPTTVTPEFSGTKKAEPLAGQVSFEGQGVPSAMQAKEMVPQNVIKSRDQQSGVKFYSGVDPTEIERLAKSLNPGERIVLVQRQDGSVYPAAFADKFYDHPARGKVESIGRMTEGGLSHGMLGKGEKIVKGQLSQEEPALQMKFRSGAPLDDLKGIFTTATRRLLRNPEELKFAANRQGEYDAGQLVNRLVNKIPPSEAEVLKSAGIQEAFPAGKKVTMEEVDKWVEENGPRAALSYSLASTKPSPYSMFGRKLYGGLPIFDPELWGQSAESVKAMKDKLATRLTKQGDLQAAEAARQSSPKQFIPASEREAAILNNPSAKPFERTPELQAQPGEKLSLPSKAGNFARRIKELASEADKVVNPWDVIYDWLDGGKATYKGALMENIRKPLDSDFNDELNLRSTLLDPIRQLIQKNKMGKRESQRIGVYLNTLQEGGRERMLKSGIDEGIIKGIERTITSEEKQTASAIRAMYDQTGPLIQKVAKDVDKVDVNLIPNYFSWQREWKKYKPEADELATNPGIPKKGATVDDVLWPGLEREGIRTQPGSLEKRLKRATSPIKIDAFEIVDRYVRDAAHYIAMRKHLKEISTIVRKPEFADTYGQMGQDLIMEHLNTIARQGRYKRNAFLDGLRKLTSRGVIAFRIPSQLVHLANVPLAQQRTGVVWWSKGLDEALTEEGQQFLRKHFAETFERGGGEPALKEVSEGQLGKQALYHRFGQAGFWLQRRIDQLNAQATVLGLYMRRLKESGKDHNDYSNVELDRKAIDDARVEARRAVASPIYKDVPPLLGRGGSLTKSLLQFQNTFLDQWSNFRYDLLHAGLAKAITGNPKLAMQMTAALGAMLMVETAIKYGYSQGLEKVTGNKPREDETFKAKLEHEALRRIPGMGQLQSQLVYGETGVPSIDVALQPIREGIKYNKATDKGTKTIAATRGIGALGEMAGLPGASQAIDIATAMERRQMFKPHTEKLREKGGKAVEDMSLKERVKSEQQFKSTQPKVSKEESAKAAERNISNIVKRGEDLSKELDKPNRQWLESRELTLPGFDNKLKLGGTTVYLTEKETTRLTLLVKEEYSNVIALLKSKPKFDSFSSSQRETAFNEAMLAARSKARMRLTKEIKDHNLSGSENEQDKAKAPKRFSIFNGN